MLKFGELRLMIHLCHAHVNHWSSSKLTNWNRWCVKSSPPPDYLKHLSSVFDLVFEWLFLHLALHIHHCFPIIWVYMPTLEFYEYIHYLHLRDTFLIHYWHMYLALNVVLGRQDNTDTIKHFNVMYYNTIWILKTFLMFVCLYFQQSIANLLQLFIGIVLKPMNTCKIAY